LDYVTQTRDGTIGLNFQPYRKSKSCSRASGSRVPTSHNEIIDKPVSPPRYNLSQLETNLQGINKRKWGNFTKGYQTNALFHLRVLMLQNVQLSV
jgi:hypothetical protein